MNKENDYEKLETDKHIANDIISGNIDSLLQYIKAGWEINKPLLIDEDGYQYRYILPIMLAIYKCIKSSIHFLVEHKAKLDIGKEHAFLYAVRYANVEIIEYLVQKGAKLNVLSHVYTNAYSEAYMGSKYNHFEIIQKFGFSAYLNTRDTINMAVCQNNYEALNKLLELSVDLNNNAKTKNNYYGDTPLIVAVYHSDINMIKYLIKHGADPDLPNLIGKTPYTIALSHNKQDILTFLKPYKKNKFSYSSVQDNEIFRIVFIRF